MESSGNAFILVSKQKLKKLTGKIEVDKLFLLELFVLVSELRLEFPKGIQSWHSRPC